MLKIHTIRYIAFFTFSSIFLLSLAVPYILCNTDEKLNSNEKEEGIRQISTIRYDPPKLSSNENKLNYSSYFGGSGEDRIMFHVNDSLGNLYVLYQTSSNNLPTTAGALLDTNQGGSYDAYIVKYAPDGKTILASTYLGGDGQEYPLYVKVDSSDNLYVMMQTGSTNMPVSPTAFDPVYNGVYPDGYVAKITNDLTTLIYGTYIGSPQGDFPYCLEVDSEDCAIICGATWSSAYPTTIGAYDTTFSGSSEGFITRFNFDGSALNYSTYIGGSSDELLGYLEFDEMGRYVICGRTTSNNFPGTTNGYMPSAPTLQNGVVLIFDRILNSIVQSTYLGGSDTEQIYALMLNEDQSVILCGQTKSSNFPTTLDCYQSGNQGGYDYFLSVLNHNLTDLLYSTTIGGDMDDVGWFINRDMDGNLHTTGYTQSTNLPVSNSVFSSNLNGTSDGLYVVFDQDYIVQNISYFGGNGDDQLFSMHINQNRTYFGLNAGSIGLSTTPDAYNQTLSGPTDAYRVILDKTDYSQPPNPIIPTPNLHHIDNFDHDGNFTLSWDSVDSIDSYHLYRSNQTIYSIDGLTPIYSGLSTSYSESNLPLGSYYYALVAENASEISDFSTQNTIVRYPYRDELGISNNIWMSVPAGLHEINLTDIFSIVRMVILINSPQDIAIKITYYGITTPISEALPNGREYWGVEIDTLGYLGAIEINLKFFYQTDDLSANQEKNLELFHYSTNIWSQINTTVQNENLNQFSCAYSNQYYGIKLVEPPEGDPSSDDSNDDNPFNIPGYNAELLLLCALSVIFIKIGIGKKTRKILSNDKRS